MKKTILIALGAGFCMTSAFAQPFKQSGKENNLQLLFAPLGNNPVSLNQGISYRKFLNPTMAVRLGFYVGSTKTTNITQQAEDTIRYPKTLTEFAGFPFSTYTLVTGLNPETQTISKSSSFSIRPGIEKHFEGTERLSPYIGAEIVFTKSTSKFQRDTLTIGNYTITLNDTASATPQVSAPWTVLSLNQKSGSTTFGINLIAGMDYYFTKNLSLGAEFSFGYYGTKYADVESEYVNNNVTSVVTGPDVNGVRTNTISNSNTVTSAPSQKQGKDSGFGPSVVAKIKLGWLF
jgi:opacity protein-like surface antigen